MPERVALLAIETSQREQSVAVQPPQGAPIEEPVHTGDRTREDLLPAIDRVMTRAGLGPGDLRAVVLNAGPGGFTGLRVAHAAAQAIALATGVGVVQVCAARCAHAAAVIAGELAPTDAAWVALAAKGGSAWLRLVGGAEQRPGEPLEADAWEPGGARRLICDAHLPEAFRRRAESAGISLLPLRMGALAVLAAAADAVAQGGLTPPERLVPAYPREAEAVRLWRLRHPARTDGTA